MSDSDTDQRPSTTRNPISKRVRFEVFKRDQFTCQYCGKKAPEVVLHVDHIKAVVAGGSNEIINLITACLDCNLGKADKPLSDSSALSKQRAQLESMQERREQLEMMAQWKQGLLTLQEDAVEIARVHWERLTQFDLNEHGQHELAKLIRKYPLDEILESMQIAADRNIQLKDGMPTQESAETAWRFLGRSCSVNARERKEPGFKRALYIRGILRNRLEGRYYDHNEALNVVTEARDLGIDLDLLERITKRATSWSAWKSAIEDLVEARKGNSADATSGEIEHGAARQGERQTLYQDLADALSHIQTADLPRIIGYVKGTGLSVEAFGEYEDDQQPPERQVTLNGSDEAFGFGDALGLQRTSLRSDRLLAYGPIDHTAIFALETDRVEGLRPSYVFKDGN